MKFLIISLSCPERFILALDLVCIEGRVVDTHTIIPFLQPFCSRTAGFNLCPAVPLLFQHTVTGGFQFVSFIGKPYFFLMRDAVGSNFADCIFLILSIFHFRGRSSISITGRPRSFFHFGLSKNIYNIRERIRL